MNNNNKGFTLIELMIVVAIIAIVASIAIPFVFGSKGVFSFKIVQKVVLIVKHNYAFWGMILLAVGFGFFQKIRNPKEFTWIELPIQLAVSFIFILLCTVIFFYTSSDIRDVEIWNGYLTHAEYYEPYATKESEYICTAHDKNGFCIMGYTNYYNVDHPAKWLSYLSTSEKGNITQGQYLNIVKRFGNETKQDITRMNQVGGGGDKFVTRCKNLSETLIPSATERTYINYRLPMLKKRLKSEKYKDYLWPYPIIRYGPFGKVEIDRVILAVKTPPAEISEWASEVDRELDRALSTLGKLKEVNILVYFIDTYFEDFASVLNNHWDMGNKNDVIVVLQTKSFPEEWHVDVLSWDDENDFNYVLQQRLYGLESLNSPENFVEIIISQIRKPVSQDGFKRKEMKDFEMMIGDISLAWWIQVIILILSAGACYGISWVLLNNRIRK